MTESYKLQEEDKLRITFEYFTYNSAKGMSLESFMQLIHILIRKRQYHIARTLLLEIFNNTVEPISRHLDYEAFLNCLDKIGQVFYQRESDKLQTTIGEYEIVLQNLKDYDKIRSNQDMVAEKILNLQEEFLDFSKTYKNAQLKFLMSEVLEIDFSQLDESVLRDILGKVWPGKKVELPKFVERTKIRDPRHDFLDARVDYLRARFLKYQPPKRKSTSPGSKLKSLSPVRDHKLTYNTPQLPSPTAMGTTPKLQKVNKSPIYSRNQVQLPEIQSLKKQYMDLMLNNSEESIGWLSQKLNNFNINQRNLVLRQQLGIMKHRERHSTLEHRRSPLSQKGKSEDIEKKIRGYRRSSVQPVKIVIEPTDVEKVQNSFAQELEEIMPHLKKKDLKPIEEEPFFKNTTLEHNISPSSLVSFHTKFRKFESKYHELPKPQRIKKKLHFDDRNIKVGSYGF